ncbi:MAG: BolA family protein [Pseudomonadota bacterium]|nr:BolA family protein [Pseudomonadota bacterium]
MKENSRKKRIETILKKNFSPSVLLVRDDSKKHEGHSQVINNTKETHFFIKMILDNNTITKVNLHRKVYNLLDNEFNTGLHALELDLKSS